MVIIHPSTLSPSIAVIPKSKWVTHAWVVINFLVVLSFQDSESEREERNVVVETVNDRHMATNGVPGNIVSVYSTTMNTRITPQTDIKVQGALVYWNRCISGYFSAENQPFRTFTGKLLVQGM